MGQRLILLLITCGSLFGQSATPIKYPFSIAQTYSVMEAQALPVGPTTVTSQSGVFIGGFVSCAGTARTFTIADGNSVAIATAIPVTANQVVSMALLKDWYFSGGFTITASGTGCTYSVWFRQ